MLHLRQEYTKKINLYKNELAVFSKERQNLKELNAWYPTRSLDVKISWRKKMIKEYIRKYEETYHV